MNAIDRDIAVSEIFSLNQIVNRSAWRERFVSVLFGVFSVLALILAAVSLISGTLAALALTRLLATQLFHVRPTDPETFLTVILVLITVSAIAAFIPARRATQVEPLVALREE